MCKHTLAKIVILIAVPMLLLLCAHLIPAWIATATGLLLQIVIQVRNLC